MRVLHPDRLCQRALGVFDPALIYASWSICTVTLSRTGRSNTDQSASFSCSSSRSLSALASAGFQVRRRLFPTRGHHSCLTIPTPGIDNFSHLGGFAMGLLVSLLLFPIIHPSRTHKLVFVGLRILVLPLIIVFYVVLVRNFYTSDPATACSWCRYLSCWPTASNNVSERRRWLYSELLGDIQVLRRSTDTCCIRAFTALQGHRTLNVLDFVVGNSVTFHNPCLDFRLPPSLNGACSRCAMTRYPASPSSAGVLRLSRRLLSVLLSFTHTSLSCHITAALPCLFLLPYRGGVAAPHLVTLMPVYTSVFIFPLAQRSRCRRRSSLVRRPL